MLCWAGMCCWRNQRLFCTCFQLFEYVSKFELLAYMWKKSQASRNCRQQARLLGFLSICFHTYLLLFSLQPILKVKEPKEHETIWSCLALVHSVWGASRTGLVSASCPVQSHLGASGDPTKQLSWTRLCFWMPLWNSGYLSLRIAIFVSAFSFSLSLIRSFCISQLMSEQCEQDTEEYCCD